MRIACSFVILFIVSSMTVWAQPAADTAKGDVLATVGNVEITREMLDHIISTIPEQNRVPFLTPDGRKKILDEVVSFTLFSQAAKDEGIDKEPAVATRLKYAQTEYLAREYFKRRLAKTKLVTEEELKTYFKRHADEFKPPEEIKARHILVRTKAQAEKIIAQLKKGADFAKLAKKYSIDPAASAGGRLTLPDGREWLPRGTFEQSFEHALFKVPTGEVGGPIKTQFGWHILKVDARRQPPIPSFVQVRSVIKQRLEERKKAELHRAITEELKKKIPVTVK